MNALQRVLDRAVYSKLDVALYGALSETPAAH